MEKGEIVFRRSPKILVTLPIINRKESVRETKISLREVRGRGHNFCKVSLHYKFEKRQYFDEYELNKNISIKIYLGPFFQAIIERFVGTSTSEWRIKRFEEVRGIKRFFWKKKRKRKRFLTVVTLCIVAPARLTGQRAPKGKWRVSR